MPRPEPLASYLVAAQLLGEKVRALREDRGLTQEELAHRTGIARNQIQNIEHNRNNAKDPQTGRPGRGNARLDTIFRLAHELDVEVTYLVDPGRPIKPLPRRRPRK
ncbi:MAG: helix-turn-helix transcriptional regulator [Micropruina sp.]|uniref:helix-turn-helix domain-containing protein n=1 Tax=Micropruina sp. TaxID=2737536 RepID=UPI0039E332CB